LNKKFYGSINSRNFKNVKIVFFPITLFMNQDKPDLNKIEKSFTDMIDHFESSSSTSFIKGMVDPNIIKKGDLNEIGKSLQNVSDLLLIKARNLELLPYESEEGGMEMRLDHYIKALKDIGKELEKSDAKELHDYHWSIIGMFIVIIFSLFDHIEHYRE
jgi:hypothetical protein